MRQSGSWENVEIVVKLTQYTRLTGRSYLMYPKKLSGSRRLCGSLPWGPWASTDIVAKIPSGDLGFRSHLQSGIATINVNYRRRLACADGSRHQTPFRDVTPERIGAFRA